ncbi:hypothetical protein Tco_1022781 [Tanacetum coccineum]
MVEGKEKRAGEELIQENTKKQKVEDDKETAELTQYLEIIPDDEEVTIDAIPLAVKSPRIVDWKIHKEGKKRYYQVIRADGKSQMYRIFSQMLKSFDREDLEDLYKLVKARYGSTRPVESMDNLLWNDMKIITFIKDAVYADLHVGREEVSSYTTYTFNDVEKKLQIDYESKMAYQLSRSIEVGSTKIDKYVNEVIKEAVHNALQAPIRERFRDLFEFEMKEILRDQMEEFNEATTKSRKRRRDGQDPPLPPPKESDQSKKKRHDSDVSALKQPPVQKSLAWKTSDTREAPSSSSKHKDYQLNDMVKINTVRVYANQDVNHTEVDLL